MEFNITKLSNDDLICFTAHEYNLFYLSAMGSEEELYHLDLYGKGKSELNRRLEHAN